MKENDSLIVADLVQGGFPYLEQKIQECQKCALHETVTNKVISKGSQHPKVVFIGEAPGKNEDETGVPFCGRAGKLLDKFIEYMALKDGEWAVINTLKCRPPANRTPTKKEIEICRPFMEAQLELMKPKIIILLGNTAEKAYGETLEWGESKIDENGTYIVKIFHPAALIYQRSREAEQYGYLDKYRYLWEE
ncbi:Type-4 uracil-DNA glycosylase [Methanimicrococcus stummii]|uniref:Type-4 uracil-DNA glycosylase n=1 Tax=Methanimicrococcus stummii TaxID=3028294 RepID=A0AA96V8I4_9EURY|nr:uracil-DNA glycosylase [Methanimicrococcus sp. Es2]WNY28692.1 Type-4 uracil-DNA glycosylase [Methanimicrococcus sp. Es2]